MIRPAGAPRRPGRRYRVRPARALARLRSSSWAIAQMSVGAGLAWFAATVLFDHEFPFFAPIAAVVALGLGAAHRVRRVAELAVGVTVGVAIGEALVDVIGRGAWQITLVVALGLVVSRLLDSGALVATQAALQAVLVLGIPQPSSGNVDRWVDAMVGGVVALIIALLTPPDPRHGADAQAKAATGELVTVLRATEAAIRAHDPDAAGRALGAARSTQRTLDSWESAVATGEEIARLSPLRRRHTGAMADRRQALTGMDRAARNTRILARRVAVYLDDGRRVPEPIADALDALAGALDRVDGVIGGGLQPQLVQDMAEVARGLHGRMSEAGEDGWVGATAVAQLRSLVVDVLTATGMTPREARALLPDPGRSIG